MIDTWTKRTYVCDPDACDTCTEITSKDIYSQFSVINITCLCGRIMNQVSEEDATIPPMDERKEMETNTAETYNPNLLVTYKSINNGEVTYPTIKVNDLEYRLEQIKHTEKQLVANANQIKQVLGNLTADGWYSDNIDKSEVLSDLCEIFGHEPKQTIRITGTISFEVDYEIPLDEVEDFDAHYFLQDNLSLDTYNGDSTVESWTVEDHDVDWS